MYDRDLTYQQFRVHSPKSVSVAGGIITLDLEDSINGKFIGDGPIGTPKAISISSHTRAGEYIFYFEISALTGTLQFPSVPSHKMAFTDRWTASTRIWTPMEIGKYKAKAEFDGTDWHLEIPNLPLQ